MRNAIAITLSSISIILCFLVIAATVYFILRVKELETRIEKKTDANKARIGRLIQELNIIHAHKRMEDDTQDQEIHHLEKIRERKSHGSAAHAAPAASPSASSSSWNDMFYVSDEV